MKKIITYLHCINIRLCIEAVLILLVIAMGIAIFTTVQVTNKKMNLLASEAKKNLRDATTRTIDGTQKRSADEFRLEAKNLKYSVIKEQYFPSINTEYEVPTTEVFVKQNTKPYTSQTYTCLEDKIQNGENHEQYMQDTFAISGSVILWCASENAIFSVMQVDSSYPTAFYISLNDQPKIVQQVDLLSRNSYSGNVSVKLISWKYAPEIDGQWFTFQVDEQTKASNAQWEPDENERYFYQWQTPNNLVLQEYCVSTKNSTTQKTKTTCSHIQQTPSPIHIR